MDGRIQEPIINFLKTRYRVDYVDAITEPGPNKILADREDHSTLRSIRARVSLSVDKHGSRLIVISGHHDCAGNPFDESRQREQIKQSITYLKASFPAGADRHYASSVKSVIELFLSEVIPNLPACLGRYPSTSLFLLRCGLPPFPRIS